MFRTGVQSLVWHLDLVLTPSFYENYHYWTTDWPEPSTKLLTLQVSLRTFTIQLLHRCSQMLLLAIYQARYVIHVSVIIERGIYNWVVHYLLYFVFRMWIIEVEIRNFYIFNVHMKYKLIVPVRCSQHFIYPSVVG